MCHAMSCNGHACGPDPWTNRTNATHYLKNILRQYLKTMPRVARRAAGDTHTSTDGIRAG